ELLQGVLIALPHPFGEALRIAHLVALGRSPWPHGASAQAIEAARGLARTQPDPHARRSAQRINVEKSTLSKGSLLPESSLCGQSGLHKVAYAAAPAAEVSWPNAQSDQIGARGPLLFDPSPRTAGRGCPKGGQS